MSRASLSVTLVNVSWLSLYVTDIETVALETTPMRKIVEVCDLH